MPDDTKKHEELSDEELQEASGGSGAILEREEQTDASVIDGTSNTLMVGEKRLRTTTSSFEN